MKTVSNTAVSPELAEAVTRATDILKKEFHGDCAVVILGRGHIVAESTARQVVEPRAFEKTPLRFRNWEGVLTDAPADLPDIVAEYADQTIVWSTKGKKHQVRYGLQVNAFSSSLGAATDFGHCVHHLEECNGKL